MSVTVTVRLDDETAEWLEAVAAETGLSKGRIVKEARATSRRRPKRKYMRLAGLISGPEDLSKRRGFSKT